MDNKKKEYGLLLPKKNVIAPVNPILKKPSVFNEDSDSEEGESNVDWVKKSLQKETFGTSRSRLSKAEIQRVLNEDPTVYQYDEVYDEMEKKKSESVAAKKSDRKPKYMQHLLLQAEKRKIENERRTERQIQRERQAEGDQFADKESFVTSAYKKKLEEMKKLDAEEKRLDMLEDIGDVTKQRDMTGFYRHLYRQTIDNEQKPCSSTEPSADAKSNSEDIKPKTSVVRQYRKRKSSESSVDSDQETAAKSSKPDVTNEMQVEVKRESRNDDQDADSPLSEDDSDDSPKASVTKLKEEPKGENVEEKDGEKDMRNLDADEAGESSDSETEKEKPKEEIPPKPKRPIWEKRTVGEVFDAALQRYFERKNLKLAASGS